ncbi:MAG: zinc-ribbon domain-containing protein [Thermoprotei archaeon]
MPKCNVCGAKNPESAISCTNCGAPLYTQTQEQTYTPPTQVGAPNEKQSPALGETQGANTPVAVVDYKAGLPVMGIVSTLVFIVIVAVSSLLSGGVSYPILAFVFILVAFTLVNMVARSRLGLGKLRYEFYPEYMKIEGGRISTTMQYSELSNVTLMGSRIIIDLTGTSRMRRIIVPQNPTLSGGSSLYAWLSSKVKAQEDSGGDSTDSNEPSEPVSPNEPPAP